MAQSAVTQPSPLARGYLLWTGGLALGVVGGWATLTIGTGGLAAAIVGCLILAAAAPPFAGLAGALIGFGFASLWLMATASLSCLDLLPPLCSWSLAFGPPVPTNLDAWQTLVAVRLGLAGGLLGVGTLLTAWTARRLWRAGPPSARWLRLTARRSVAASGLGAIGALGLCAIDESRAVDDVRGIFGIVPRGTVLWRLIGDAFSTAWFVLAIEVSVGIVLLLLVVFGARRLVYLVVAAWSLATLVTLLWLVVPTLPDLSIYIDTSVGIPTVVAAGLVGLFAGLALVASLVGIVVTPLGWDWLSAPPPIPQG